METGDSTASDGDEQGGEQEAGCGSLIYHGLAGSRVDDCVAVCVNCSIRCVEVGECGDLQIGSIAGDGSAHNADERKGDHAVQQERAQEVAGLKQNPNGGNGSNHDIYAQQDHPCGVIERDQGEVVADGNQNNDDCDGDDDIGDGGDLAAAGGQAVYDCYNDEQHGNHRGALICKVRSLGCVCQVNGEGVGNDRSEGGNNQDQGQVSKDAEQLLCGIVDVFGDNRCDGLALMAQGCEQSAEVVHSAEEDTANQYPQQNGNPAKYGSLNGAVDGASASNRGKVVAKQDVGLGGHVVYAVVHFLRGGRATGVNTPLLCQPSAVQHVADYEDGKAAQKDDHCVHL